MFEQIIKQNNLDRRVIPLTRVLDLKQVSALTSLKPTTLYKLIKENKFPSSISLGDKRKGWIDQEVQDWIEARIKDRDQGHGS